MKNKILFKKTTINFKNFFEIYNLIVVIGDASTSNYEKRGVSLNHIELREKFIRRNELYGKIW